MTFSWLKAPTSTSTFKTLLRHYAKVGGLLRDCEIFANLRIAFVSSSTGHLHEDGADVHGGAAVLHQVVHGAELVQLHGADDALHGCTNQR